MFHEILIGFEALKNKGKLQFEEFPYFFYFEKNDFFKGIKERAENENLIANEIEKVKN